MGRAKESVDVNDLSRSDIEHLIDEWIVGKNAQRDRAILRRRLLDGIIYDKRAEEFDLSVRHVKKIVYSGEDRIFKHIES